MRLFFAKVGAFVSLLLLFVAIAPWVLVWPTMAWRNRLSLLAGRLWARVVLALAGVRVEYRGVENLRHPAILTFNHSSYLDFFFNAPLAGSRCMVFGKRELARLPFLGWAWLLGGHPLIKREDPSHWKREMERTARVLREEGYSSMIAPEGRRSRDGALLPFKKGAFHLALDSGLPLQPVVIHGAAERMKTGFPTPGRVVVEVLPPIETSGWSEDELDLRATELRERYAARLDAAAATPAG